MKRIPFFTLCFGSFLDWMSYGIVYPFFAALVFHPEWGFLSTTSEVLRSVLLGVLVAASPLGQFFSSPILGRLSDRMGRRPILQVTFLVIILGYFFSALGIWTQSFSWLVLGCFVTGVGAGNISVINSSVADLSKPHEKAKNFALIAMASGMGFTAGPLVGGELSMWGYDIPFIGAALLTVIAFGCFTFLFSETHPRKEGGFQPWRWSQVIQFPSFKSFPIFFSAFFVFCFGWSFYWAFIPVTWIKLYNCSVSQIGNFYAYGSAFYVLSSGVLVRPIMKKFKSKSILMGGWGLLGIFFFLLFHTGMSSYWVYIPIQQFLVALIFPVGTAIVSNAVTGDQQGEALGNFQSLQSLAFALTPLIGGGLLSLNYSTPVIIGGVAMILAFLILFMSPKRDKL